MGGDRREHTGERDEACTYMTSEAGIEESLLKR